MNSQTADGPEQPIADLHAATERLGKATFTVHGMATAVRDLLNDVKGMLTGMKSERGPVDYDVVRDERRALTSVLRDLLKEIRSRPPPSMNNGDDSSDIKKWIAGLGVVISGAFIIGGWVLSNQVAGQSVQIEYQNAQLRELNARVTRIEQQRNERP